MIATHHSWHTVWPGQHEGGGNLQKSRLEVVDVDASLTGMESLQVMTVHHHQCIIAGHHAPGLAKVLYIFHGVVATDYVGQIPVEVELDRSTKFGVFRRGDASAAIVDHFVVNERSAVFGMVNRYF